MSQWFYDCMILWFYSSMLLWFYNSTIQQFNDSTILQFFDSTILWSHDSTECPMPCHAPRHSSKIQPPLDAGAKSEEKSKEQWKKKRKAAANKWKSLLFCFRFSSVLQKFAPTAVKEMQSNRNGIAVGWGSSVCPPSLWCKLPQSTLVSAWLGERVSCPSALVLGWISGFLGQLGAAGEAPGGVLPMSHPRTYSKFTASSCQLWSSLWGNEVLPKHTSRSPSGASWTRNIMFFPIFIYASQTAVL